MARCTEKTLSGKRCKNSASHDGRCMIHVGSAIGRFLKPETDTAPAGMKRCGHTCHLTTQFCCSCSDNRPLDAIYYRFVDGAGDMPTGYRDDGYCYLCKYSKEKPIDYEHLSDMYLATHSSLVNQLSYFNRSTIEQIVAMALNQKRIRQSSKDE